MRYVVGVDIGSTTTKTVIMGPDAKIVARNVIQRGIVDEAAANLSLSRCLRQVELRRKDIEFIVTTGYGRSLVKFGDKNITEISCHARGAHYFAPDARSVIDIGGQDSKCIIIDGRGGVMNFAMNDKCAAGTGRFIEVMSRALRVPLNDMGAMSQRSQHPCAVSSLCTVFAESEVISLVAQGRNKEDIVAGIHEAIGRRILALTKVARIQSPIMMSGGVAKNSGIVKALERLLNTTIVVAEEPQFVGAIGAALYALDEIEASAPAAGLAEPVLLSSNTIIR